MTSWKILCTNDDGIFAPGLVALADAMKELGTVYVCAPATEQSAMSHALSLYRPLRMHKIKPGWFSVEGTPTDAVYAGLSHFLKDESIDLVVSGINPGPNMGDDISYSGTVAAAMEGAVFGKQSMAVSLASRDHLPYDKAAKVAVRVARNLLKNPLPAQRILNVNIPADVNDSTPFLVTRQGWRDYQQGLEERKDPRGKTYYWIGGDPMGTRDSIVNADIAAVDAGNISLTPLTLNLTCEQSLNRLSAWPQMLSRREEP